MPELFLSQEIRRIIDYIDEMANENQAREPNAYGVKTMLINALKKSGYKPD